MTHVKPTPNRGEIARVLAAKDERIAELESEIDAMRRETVALTEFGNERERMMTERIAFLERALEQLAGAEPVKWEELETVWLLTEKVIKASTHPEAAAYLREKETPA